MKKVGYVTFADPSDRKSRSGTIYKMREAIEAAGFEVIWIPYRRITGRTFFYWIWIVLRNLLGTKKWLGGEHYTPIAKGYAKSVDMDLVCQCDYLFFPFAGQIYSFMNTNVPLIYFSDATLHLMVGYYWKNLSGKSIRMAESLDIEGCKKALVNIRSSKWALESTINDCHCAPDKCYVLELGPTIDSKDILPNSPYNDGPLQLLFSGIDWNRKGGEIAVEVTEKLIERGFDAHLTVVGPSECPDVCKDKGFISYLGFMDKNSSEGYQNYLDIYRRSHILILPTTAECAGIVYSEASAFGIPCYTYDTGGTTNYVINDYNGYAFPINANASVFADKIINDIQAGRLRIYHENALRLSKEKLSWEAWAKGFARIMKQVDTVK